LDEAIALGADPKRCANLLLSRGAALANERGGTIAEAGVSAKPLAELVGMLQAGKINATAAAKLFDLLAERGGRPGELAQAEGLGVVADSGAIEAWVEEAVAANPQAAADVKSGGKKQKQAFGFLTGQVMQRSGGAAQPAAVQRLLREKLGGC